MSKMVYTPEEASEWMNLPSGEVRVRILRGEMGFLLNDEPRISGEEIQRYISRTKKRADGTRMIREGAK